MGQKINPVSLRLQSSNRSFDNSWYSNYFYTNLIIQDLFLKDYFNNFLKGVKLPTGRYSIQHLPKKSEVYNFSCMSKQTREWRSTVLGLLKRKNSLTKTRYFLKTKKQGKRKVNSSTKLISFYRTINPLAVYKIQKKFTSFQNFQLWSHLLKTQKTQSLLFKSWENKSSNLSDQFFSSEKVVPKIFLTSFKNLIRKNLKNTTSFHQFLLIEKMKNAFSTAQKKEFKKSDSFGNSLELTPYNNSCLVFLQNLSIYKILKSTSLERKKAVSKRTLDSLLKTNKKTTQFCLSEFNLLNFKYRNYLESSLSGFFNKQVEFIPFKVKSDWQNATNLADEIVYFLEKRVPFRRLKSNLLKQLSKNPQIRGVRITCSGRGGGKSKKAQRAKTECIKYGQTSLHVLSSPIDFAVKTAFTSFGSVGIKVWISFN